MSRIDEVLEQAAAQQVVPGVVALAGDRDGTVYEGAFGQTSVADGGTAVTPQTFFWIASMTKAMVSAAALRLIERDVIELDQPVADVLPAFGELQVLEGFDGDEPRLRAPKSHATMRHLLTHTSGASYFFSNEDVLRYHEYSGIPSPIAGKVAMLQMPLVADPGTRWEYGTSTDWLGQVVEKVSGKDLETYCREHIFGPLGMADTTFIPADQQAARAMAMHARAPDGGLVEFPLPEPEEPDFLSGGGGASSTGPDYLRFLRALLRGGELDGERILRPETVDLALQDHLGGVALPELIKTAAPEFSNDVPAWPVKCGWGLGFQLVLEDMEGMRRAGTGFWAGLSNCYFWLDRTSGIAGVFLTQVLPYFDERIVDTALGFEQAVYAEVGAPAAA